VYTYVRGLPSAPSGGWSGSGAVWSYGVRCRVGGMWSVRTGVRFWRGARFGRWAGRGNRDRVVPVGRPGAWCVRAACASAAGGAGSI